VENVEERLKSLMLQSLDGDEEAYRRLLRESGERLRAYFSRRLSDPSMADDLVQETLIAIHTRRGSYDRERPFTVWLHAIARYKLIDHVRKLGRHKSVAIDDMPEELIAVDERDSVGARQDLDQMLETVSDLHRGLIRAVKIEGRSIAEASAASGLSESAVKVAIHRALERLKKRISREGAS
jgi:RNA polymerase sigma-70 factor, ECF subfamily